MFVQTQHLKIPAVRLGRTGIALAVAVQIAMVPERCSQRLEVRDTSPEPCAGCMLFYKGLLNALILSCLAWGLILLVVFYAR